MTTHVLKTHPEPFQAVLEKRKPYEIRKADRPFKVGDTLRLREWEPCTCGTTLIPLCGGDRCLDRGARGYTGRETLRRITCMTSPGYWGLPPDVCVLGLGDA